jgi:periplasmic divalent cation tolerance protein
MAACVQRVQYVKSYYIREGKLTQEEEKILIIKTTGDKKEKIQAYFAKNHPYKIPEMIWIKPDDVHEEYAKWVWGAAPTK